MNLREWNGMERMFELGEVQSLNRVNQHERLQDACCLTGDLKGDASQLPFQKNDTILYTTHSKVFWRRFPRATRVSSSNPNI